MNIHKSLCIDIDIYTELQIYRLHIHDTERKLDHTVIYIKSIDKQLNDLALSTIL